MSRPKGSAQKKTLHKVEAQRVSPDDIKYKLAQMAKLSATDTRTEAERMLGDPPAWRSALAQKRNSARVQNAYARLWTFGQGKAGKL